MIVEYRGADEVEEEDVGYWYRIGSGEWRGPLSLEAVLAIARSEAARTVEVLGDPDVVLKGDDPTLEDALREIAPVAVPKP